MKLHWIWIVLIILFFYKCSSSPNEPKNEQNILPQINIPWPSLADSPWPMNHHDPQSTGRSSYLGPSQGIVETKISLQGIEGSLSLDKDNNIYISDRYLNYKLYKFSISGELIWERELQGATSCTPLLGAENVIYTSNGTGDAIFALNYLGEMIWKKINPGCFNLSFNIGLDSNLYFVDKLSTLNVINSVGKTLWKLEDSRFRFDANGAPTFSPDGKYLYIQGNGVSVLAVNTINRNIEWVFGNTDLLSSPVIDNSGNIYIIPEVNSINERRTLYSINSSGLINWTYGFAYGYQFDNTEPTIDYNGNIYFGRDTLYSVNYLGELNWKKSLNSQIIVSPLISDIECNIYLGTAGSDSKKNLILSFDKNGNKRWELEIFDERLLGASAAITNDGRMVFPTFRAWNLIIIK